MKSVRASMTKTLPTNTAKMRLLSTVNSQMLLQSCSFPNRFATDEARPFSLSSMSTFYVAFQISCIIKLSPTNVTGKRPEMEFFLMFQSCKSGFKVLFTVGTLKWFILRVKDHMLFQMRSASEGLLTNIAFPTFTLCLFNRKKFLHILWMKPLHVFC